MRIVALALPPALLLLALLAAAWRFLGLPRLALLVELAQCELEVVLGIRGVWIEPQRLLQGVQRRADGSPFQGLSAREVSILEGLMLGESNKVIARKLEIAEATVKVHVKVREGDKERIQIFEGVVIAISALLPEKWGWSQGMGRKMQPCMIL